MWSIAIYSGRSPFTLADAPGVVNPVLTRDSVTDVAAKFVADPFMLKTDGVWNMFFEVMNRQSKKGEIGLATSKDGINWTYQQIVLREAFHLSYPCVFQWQDEYYMIPETYQANSVRLYRANPFPTRWSFVGPLLQTRCADPTIFRFQEKWWMFICATPFQHDSLRLYFADSLTGPWSEHPSSPVIEGDKQNARPAGRVLVSGGKIIRFAQDCVNYYGNHVRAFEISELTTTSYTEHEFAANPILTASGKGWNESGMHHVDAHQLNPNEWLACVDGINSVE